jgi:hypothetical protein
MKRQPKPFAVEIKRSRHPLPLASSQLGAPKRARNWSEKTSLPNTFGKAPTVAELTVPAFLQSTSGSDQSITEGGRRVFLSGDARQAGARKPRILPSLTTEIDSAEPKGRTNTAKKLRSRKAFAIGAPKEPRVGRRKKSLPHDTAAKSPKRPANIPRQWLPCPSPSPSRVMQRKPIAPFRASRDDF